MLSILSSKRQLRNLIFRQREYIMVNNRMFYEEVYMKKLLPDIAAALKSGERVVLAAVQDSCGSAPRKTCSVMAVFADGRSLGSIGGGAIEFEVQKICREEMHSAPENALTKIEGYTLLPDGKGDLRMVCGGDVTIYFRTLLPTPEITGVFEQAVNDSRDRWLCIETVGTGAIFLAEKTTEKSGPLMSRPNYDEEGAGKCLTYPLSPSGYVYIFGGGHVGRALVETLTRIDFECIVYDEREEYASVAAHPLAVCAIHGAYTAIERTVRFTAADYVIVVTHGHQFDFEVLAQTVASKVKYVGCMGSRRKTAVIRERLKNEAGIEDADMERLHAPIGLEIGAETPEELAVSIAAELIAIRAAG